MKVAIATDNNKVHAHFGGCDQYTIFEISNHVIQSRVIIDAPPHEPGILPGFLSEKGVTHVIAGGMGARAQSLFEHFHITTIIGVSGTLDEVISDFISGKLVSGESLCSQGSGGHFHDCGHDHHDGGHHH